MPFRRENLFKYITMPPTVLEQAESIDMLRILEHGLAVRLVKTTFSTQSVDVPKDISLVDELMQTDPLCRLY